MRHWLYRGLEVRFPGTTTHARELIAQVLVLGAQDGDVRRLCLNEVQQLDDDRARYQIGNRVRVEVRNLHMQVVY